MTDNDLPFRSVLLEEINEIRNEALSGTYGKRGKTRLLARLEALKEIVE